MQTQYGRWYPVIIKLGP